MQRTLTSGPITSSILLFALPLMFGNLLQQMYNIADTWVVGRFLGADALAAVGSSYTLMTFLTSILLGLCMGSGAAISMQYGSGESEKMRRSVFQSFVLIAGIALVLNLLVYLGLDGILWVLRVPEEGLPPHHLPRHHGHLPLQLLCKPSPRHRQLGGAAGLSGRVGHPERLPRPVLRHRPRLGHQGGGRRDGIFTVRIGRRHRRLYPEKIPGALPPAGGLPLG